MADQQLRIKPERLVLEEEALNLLHVRWFQVASQFTSLQPQTRLAGVCWGGSIGQNGLEEEHFHSNQTVRPGAFGQFVLVDSAGGVAEERRFEISCRRR